MRLIRISAMRAKGVNGVRIVKFDSKVNHKMKTLAAGTVTVGAFNVDTRQYYEFNVTVSDVLLGDVDGNGSIEVKDITLLQNYMAGAAELTQKTDEGRGRQQQWKHHAAGCPYDSAVCCKENRQLCGRTDFLIITADKCK